MSKPKTTGKVDKSKALKLRLENKLTYQEIADTMQVTKQAVHTALHKLIPIKTEVDEFRNNHADILTSVQAKMLLAYDSLDYDEQKEMVKRRGLVDMGIAFDKMRVLQGMSTDNIAVTVQAIQAIQDMEAIEVSTL